MIRRHRILAIGDQESFAQSVQDLLVGEGYQCDCGAWVTTTIRMLEDGEYDLLISEANIRGATELELVRSLPHVAEGLPVILVTDPLSATTAIEWLKLPVVACMLTPLNHDELLAEVRTSVGYCRSYRAVCAAQQRLRDWSEDLTSIQEAMRLWPASASHVPIAAFSALTVRNAVGSLLDIQHLMEATALGSERRDACHLFNCPRSDMLMGAIREAISVLEKTKTAFKSKELAQLRRRLEEMVGVAGEMDG